MNQANTYRRSGARRRWGVSLVIVLGILTITLAMSYAIVRVQATSVQIQSNGKRTLNARQAALTGVSEGLRRMRLANWPGVDTSFTIQVGDDAWSDVVYSTGDSSLLPSSSDYAEFPYRVTVTSTGYAADPTDPDHRAMYKIEAVSQLIRRALYAAPQQWDATQNYTLLQWSSQDIVAELPLHVEGAAYMAGALRLAETYPTDARPFDGNLDEIAVYEKAISASEIAYIYFGFYSYALPDNMPISWWRFEDAYDSNILTDAMGLHPGTYQGASPAAAGGPRWWHGNGASFDGYDDLIDLNTFNISGNQLTIVAWFKVDDFDAPKSNIIAKSNGVSDQEHWWMLGIEKNHGLNRLCFRVKTESGGTKTLRAHGGNLYPGQWMFAAAVYDGEKMRLYLNGAPIAETNKSGNLANGAQVGVWMGDAYPGSPKTKYLAGLNAMRAGGADYRPFTGPVDLMGMMDMADNHAKTDLLQDALGVVVNEATYLDGSAINHPGEVATYRLYPGGKAYDVPSLGSRVQNATWEPDVLTNPLGVFRRANDLELGDNAKIRGTLISTSTRAVEVRGTNVVLEGVPLPKLDGQSSTFQLPTMILRDDFKIKSDSQSSLLGQAVVFETFNFDADHNAAFHLTGRLFTSELIVKPRADWSDLSRAQWQQMLADYLAIYGADIQPAVLFPEWVLQQSGLSPEPQLTMKPDDQNIRYHWHDWTQPVFVARFDDNGLVWDLVDWRENP